jgi:molecular chaperone GrpE
MGKRSHTPHAGHHAAPAHPEAAPPRADDLEEPATPGPELAGTTEMDAGVGAPGAAASAADEEVLRRLERETAEWKDRALRAAADLENVKKRAAKERAETWGRAQADLITRALDALDDLGRIAALDPGQTSSEALHEGVGLVERKLQKVLEGIGLERVDPAGQPFDPNLHEAVMAAAAPSPEADHQVGSVFQPGYRLNGTLIRPARVAVLTWTEPAAGAGGGE